MSEALPLQSTVGNRLRALCAYLMPKRRARAKKDVATPDETRARLDFCMEMLDNHPDAFRSEMDVQHLAWLYRGKY